VTNPKTILRATSAAVLALLLAGTTDCGQQQPTEPAAPAAAPGTQPQAQPEEQPPVADRPRAAPSVTLTEADADRHVRLERGQVIEVRLQADRVSGYTWIPKHNVMPVMSTDGVPQYEIDEATGSGAPGTEIWRFIGREPGHVHLVFEYLQPFGGDMPPQETIVFHFDVE
jgi:predicted secreted protein